ncbi:MAG: hypothetical protein IH600_08045 [Bacteroidetes bacterium]|nr:hypothetical protein [Bacteroidota bacterium]
MPEIEKELRRQGILRIVISIEQFSLGIRVRQIIITPVGFSCDKLSMPVVSKVSVPEWKNEEGVTPGPLVVDQYLCVWISQRDLYRPRQRLFVCFVFFSSGVVIHIFSVSMNDENECVAQWNRRHLLKRRTRRARSNRTAGKQDKSQQQPAFPSKDWRKQAVAAGIPFVLRASHFGNMSPFSFIESVSER